MTNENSYTHYLSVLKCMGMFAVIGIHVFCTPLSYYHNFYSSFETFLSYFVTNALRAWAVPVFVMVSGSLFLDKSREIPLQKLYGKYILRLFLVLFTFGTVFALMERLFNAHFSFGLKMIPLAFLDVYEGKLWDHLWFVYMIAGLYIVTPPLKIFIKNADDKILKYLLSVLFVFTCLIPFVNKISDTKCGFYIPVSTIWLFYYLLGYAIHFEILEINDFLAMLCILIGLLWCIFGQFVSNMTEIEGAHLDYAGTSDLIAVFMSTGIFSLAKSKCKNKVNFTDTFINPFSFGVYVIHALFINFILKFLHFTPENHSVFLVWAVLFFFTATGSLSSVWILRKIPFMRKWIL